MKHGVTFLVMILLGINVFCQSSTRSTVISKPPIDSAAIANWADLLWSEPTISANGKYFMYQIDNLPAGNHTLVVQETEGSWKKEFVGAEKGFFSPDSKQAVFKSNDSLYLLLLGANNPVMVLGVNGYKRPAVNDVPWLAYEVKGSQGSDVVLHNLVTGKEQRYQNVREYQFDKNGKVLLVKRNQPKEGAATEVVQWINLSGNKVYTVWQAEDKKRASRFQFDDQGKQLVFIVENNTNGKIANEVWHYKEGIDKAIAKVTDQSAGIDSGMIVSNITPTISKNGKYIFFKIQPIPEPARRPDPNAVQVDVWSYNDKYPGDNPNELRKDLIVSLSLENGKLFCVEKKGVTNVFTPGPGDFAIVSHRNFVGDRYWINEPISYYLVSLKDDSINLINTGFCYDFAFTLDGKYLVYFDYDKSNYFSYNIATGKVVNISCDIPEPITRSGDKGSTYKQNAVGIKGWLDATTVMVYDNYDIWKVDITGKKIPINLTNGYGKKHHIRFRLLDENSLDKNIFYPRNSPLTLAAFDNENKYNGFYLMNSERATVSELLKMGPYLFFIQNDQTEVGLTSMKPLKAEKVDAWIIKRQTATEAPNFFLTKDFKEFKQLTNLQPQEPYNWMKTELMTWKQFDGKDCQGILYKPQDFDSTKKYPVIINYYEKISDCLFEFLQPELISGNLNIPWFVSRGYIVFTPDINYTIGKTGESAINSVVSGAMHLFQYPFIDSTKVGIQGHSFGGYETNFLITHTNIFAAAVEGAGASNFISYYGTVMSSRINSNLILHFEPRGQYRIQSTLWNGSQSYIENSPIFNAHKVSTPLLIMHNKNDMQVPWSQAVEFFIALRRLNRKVWMLQYDNGGHGVGGKNSVDYTIRMTQFFDHYLKSKPAPVWMVNGIPANLKGIESGYQLSNSAAIP